MELRLMTPARTLFEGEAVSLAGRSPGGEFEIRPGHGAWVAPTEACALSVRLATGAHDGGPAEGGETLRFAVHGGIIEVDPGSVLILADAAEAAKDIDGTRAESARARAEERLRSARASRAAEADEVDVDRARRALARALARLEAQAATP